MVARRGKPLEVISDNGTNFTAANKELRDLVGAMDKEQIRQQTKGSDGNSIPLAVHIMVNY